MKTIEIICKNCNKIVLKPLKEYIRQTKRGRKHEDWFCNISCGARYANLKIKNPTILVNCQWCKKEFTTPSGKRQRKCCTIICSSKYGRSQYKFVMTPEIKAKMSQNTKNQWKNPEYRNKILNNPNNKNNKIFSSKGERDLREHFKTNFPEESWTFGGGLYHKDITICRDLYSNKLKISIEYDGIWHFKDIKGQLADKQMKDKALEDWSLENGWRLIRIKDELYLKNKEFWIDKIRKEILYGTNKIVKFYENPV